MRTQEALNVKCIMGLIYQAEYDISHCLKHLERVFGPRDLLSERFIFDFTDYYEPEMGSPLYRIFISFENLIRPGRLAEIKRLTNIIEDLFARNGKRCINLDPGYLDLDKFVLASAKYAGQKIFLGGGIYADPTLYFYQKAFHAYSWSFPDFRTDVYRKFFLEARVLYKQKLKQ